MAFNVLKNLKFDARKLPAPVWPPPSNAMTNETDPSTARLALLLSLTPFFLGYLTLQGWSGGKYELSTFDHPFSPMNPSTAIVFVLFSLGFMGLVSNEKSRFTKYIVRLISFVGFFVAIFSFLKFFGYSKIELEWVFINQTQKFGRVATGRISPVLSVCIFFASVVLFILTTKPNKFRLKVAGFMTTVGMSVTLTIFLGYLYGTPEYHGTPVIPVAILTGMGLGILLLGFALIIGPSYLPLKLFTGTSTRSRLLRAFLPASFFSVVIHGMIFKYVPSHFNIDFAFLSAISAIVFAIVTMFVTLEVANIIGSEIDLVESKVIHLSNLKTEFLNNISHDLREPLGRIMEESDALLQSNLSEEQVGRMHHIRNSGLHLSRMVDGILYFSVAHSEGQIVSEKTVFELRGCIDGIIEQLSPECEEKGIKVICNIEPDVPAKLLGDSKHLSQVLFNLINTSLRFTKTGELFLSVDLARVTNGGLTVAFEIIAPELEIPEDVKTEISSVLSDTENAVAQHMSQVSIGIALCKSIVEGIGGTVDFDCEAPIGATFWFSVVFESADEQRGVEPQAPNPPESEPKQAA